MEETEECVPNRNDQLEEEHKQCSICFEDPIEKSKEVRVPCGHSFCDTCLTLVVEQEDNFRSLQDPDNFERLDMQLFFSRRGRYLRWRSKRTFRCPLCRSKTAMNDIIRVATNERLRTNATKDPPLVTTIYGESYYQWGGDGVASYHFESEDCCYISYHNAEENWLLDDGTKPPVQKMFVNTHYDASTRTFVGTIEWPIKFQGDALWEYNMVFSDDFMIIESGLFQSYKIVEDPKGVPDVVYRFDKEVLRYENSRPALDTIYGQVYVQVHAENVAAYHFPPLGSAEGGGGQPWAPYLTYHNVASCLDDGSNFPEKKYFVNPSYNSDTRTFTGEVHWAAPALCSESNRWVYTMKFSHDCATIEGGEVLSFTPNESEPPRSTKYKTFGTELLSQFSIEFHLFYRNKLGGEKAFYEYASE